MNETVEVVVSWPGEQQRHHLVADLQVAERVAVLVVGVEQQAEDVAAALAAARRRAEISA